MSLGSTINFRFELSGLCLKSREHLGTTPPLVRFYAESLRKAKQRRRSELGAYHCAGWEDCFNQATEEPWQTKTNEIHLCPVCFRVN